MKSPEKPKVKTEKRRKGDIGEEVACKYLINKGYFVKERNYWKPWGEIDIVATKAEGYRFIEVKTVSREKPDVTKGNVAREMEVRPEENFHPAKLKRLHRAVQTYLLQHKVPESVPWQIDLACVYLNFDTKKAKVELFENVIL
jgi:putative endonuclease